MQMLSEDDLNLRDLTPEELEAAWDLWFDLAQATNADDPSYEHGVFVAVGRVAASPAAATRPGAGMDDAGRRRGPRDTGAGGRECNGGSR